MAKREVEVSRRRAALEWCGRLHERMVLKVSGIMVERWVMVACDTGDRCDEYDICDRCLSV